MAYFTDKNRFLVFEINIRDWHRGQHGTDRSDDFYNVGALETVGEYFGHAVKLVDDIDYLIKYASDWKLGLGDFSEDGESEGFDPWEREFDLTRIDPTEVEWYD